MDKKSINKSDAAEVRFIAYQEIYRSAAEFEVAAPSSAPTPSAKANKTLQSKITKNGDTSLSDPIRQKMSAEAKLTQQSKNPQKGN